MKPSASEEPLSLSKLFQCTSLSFRMGPSSMSTVLAVDAMANSTAKLHIMLLVIACGMYYRGHEKILIRLQTDST